ncbi:MAG TPA: MFS transporter, partial [Planctomycetaceae bacterium]|nr:MFS transporter [Planctomycetaceae bacterium]
MSREHDHPLDTPDHDTRPWYAGITRYQWLVLVIASLGWVFDVFEGQIFVASMNEAMPSLLPEDVKQLDAAERQRHAAFYNNITFGAFLLGGALGGILFGVLSDRIGRKRVMTFTIVMYSLFTAVSAFSQAWWHMAWFRFLVAMGVGGEWAVASTLVAEVFPKRARAWSLGIFHASSVFGTYLAILAGVFIVGNPDFARWVHARLAGWLGETMDPSLPWRLGFLVGVLPALLIIWIRRSLREPETWQQARTTAVDDLSRKLGSFGELFAPGLRRNTLIGFGLAAVGMATFWGAHIYGKDLMRRDVEPYYVPKDGHVTVPADERRGHLEPLLAEAFARVASNNGEQSLPQELTAAVRHAVLTRDLRMVELETVEP